MQATTRGGAKMERKIISVSQKRQITIPQKYFDSLGFDNEAECILENGGIFVRPVKAQGGEFSEQILADLIGQGFSGQTLLTKFKEQNQKIRPAVEKLIEEADEVARTGKPIPLDDLFGSEEA